MILYGLNILLHNIDAALQRTRRKVLEIHGLLKRIQIRLPAHRIVDGAVHLILLVVLFGFLVVVRGAPGVGTVEVGIGRVRLLVVVVRAPLRLIYYLTQQAPVIFKRGLNLLGEGSWSMRRRSLLLHSLPPLALHFLHNLLTL